MARRRRLAAWLAVGALLTGSATGCQSSSAPHAVAATSTHRSDHAHRATLHYAANDYGRHARARLRHLGYRLADIASASLLRAQPRGVLGLAYVGMCGGNTKAFRSTVDPYRHSRKLFGFYLVDEPAPRTCPASHLRAEASYVHSHFATARTFIVLQNMATWDHPRFPREYTRPSTGIDLLGLDPYPCRTELHGCDFPEINRSVRTLERAGVGERRIVPVFQAFGGGSYTDGNGGHWKLPTPGQATRIICRWAGLVPHPVFDYTYSWGVQQGDVALSTAPRSLRAVFAAHNRGRLSC